MGHLELLRQHEFNSVQHLFSPGSHVLELGAGTGYQARCISELGCRVTAVDLRVPAKSYFPVHGYDGRHIPANDATFDIVFSSNVLEHVPCVVDLLIEIKRVLKPSGVAIHLLPTSSWRFWTLIGFAGWAARRLAGCCCALDQGQGTSIAEAVHRDGLLHILTLPLHAHGEYRNALVELWYFSVPSWRRVFARAGFAIDRLDANHLFYTGYGILPDLTIPKRQRLAKWFGSACNIFITRSVPDDRRPK